jgi:hypothetical protein
MNPHQIQIARGAGWGPLLISHQRPVSAIGPWARSRRTFEPGATHNFKRPADLTVRSQCFPIFKNLPEMLRPFIGVNERTQTNPYDCVRMFEQQ